MGMRYEVVLVTPAMAKEWLKKNQANRRLRSRLVNQYAELMRTDRWPQRLPQPIVFDTQKKLRDGQHRLHAIIASGKSYWMSICYDAPPESAFYIDIGARRTFADVVTIAFERPVGLAASQTFLRFFGGAHVTQMSEVPLTREEWGERFTKYEPLIEEVGALFETKKKGISRTPVRAAVARAWQARPQERERIKDFVNTLYTGQYGNYEEDSAAIMLRDFLVGSTTRYTGSSADREIFLKTEGALEAFLAREPRRKTMAVTRERFAIPDDKEWAA
jgi:hypothetical protein